MVGRGPNGWPSTAIVTGVVMLRTSWIVTLAMCVVSCSAGHEAGSAEDLRSIAAPLITSAVYDATLRTPKCGTPSGGCDTGTLVNGRASLGPEPNQSNTWKGSCIDGTAGVYHVDESIDRIRVFTADGTDMAPGKTVYVETTVWAYTGYTGDKLDIYFASDATAPVWTFLRTLTPSGSGTRTLTMSYTLPTGGSHQAVRASFRYGGSASPCPSGSYNDRDDIVFAVGASPPPDTTPPTTSITSYGSASGLPYGFITVRANASDDRGVSKVEFYADSLLLGTSLLAPYSVTWDSTKSPGTRVLTTRAYDAAGNVGISAPFPIDVMADTTPPVSTTLSSPTDQSEVSRTVTLTGVAQDDVAISKMEFYRDGLLLGTVSRLSLGVSTYSYNWVTDSETLGAHVLTARSYDTAGNSTISSPVTVNVVPPPLGIVNGDFEAGLALGWTKTGVVWDDATGHAGAGNALLKPTASTRSTLSQVFDVPANAAQIVYWVRVSNRAANASDYLRGVIQDVVTGQATALDNFAFNTVGYEKHSNLIMGYAGRRVRLFFEINAVSGNTDYRIDDVSIQ